MTPSPRGENAAPPDDAPTLQRVPADLSPSGSASTLFLRRQRTGSTEGPAASHLPGPGAGGGAVLPDALCERLRAADLPASSIWLAWEVARCAPAASAEERRALALLTIGLLGAMDAGSACLRLAHGPLTASMPPLPGEASSWVEAQSLGEAIVAGRTPLTLAHLFGAEGARTVFIVAHGGIYAQRLWALEERVRAQLSRRVDARSTLPASAITEALGEIFADAPTPLEGRERARARGSASPPAALTQEQREATRAALERRLTIITGGPGTGKTSTIVAVLRALDRLGVKAHEIALAAPTGRAAQRITESLSLALRAPPSSEPARGSEAGGGGLEAQADPRLGEATDAITLHRLLGIRGERVNRLDLEVPTFYRDWRLPQRFVIVDEASMIDLPLMDALLAALADDASLVLVGDGAQLPSVELGAVFRDLVAGVPRIVTRLTRSHRVDARDPAGAEILAVASSINEGGPVRVGTGRAATPRGVSALLWRGFETLAATALPAFLVRWRSEILAADSELGLGLALDRRFTFRHRRLAGEAVAVSEDAADIHRFIGLHARARVLCLTRASAGQTSVASVNAAMHRLFQRASMERTRDRLVNVAAFIPGEPVLITRNDYRRELVNGELGVILRGSSGDQRDDALYVAFARPRSPQGLMFHPLDELREQLTLAFALTVHKAQGSEYDRVALVLPRHDIPLLTREILYTALTRARRSVVVIGDLALLDRGAARVLARSPGLPL